MLDDNTPEATVADSVSWDKDTKHMFLASGMFACYEQKADGKRVPWTKPGGYSLWYGRAGERDPDQLIQLGRLKGEGTVTIQVFKRKEA